MYPCSPRPRKPKRHTITNASTRHWPRESSKMLSGKHGAVHFSSLATTHHGSAIALACTHTTLPTARAASVTVASCNVRERPFTPTQSDARRRSPFAFVT